MQMSGQRHTARQGKDPRVPIGQEAGCTPEPILTQRLEEKSFASAGERPPVNQSVIKHYTMYPWWWRQYAPLKRRSTIILHGSASQKTILNTILTKLPQLLLCNSVQQSSEYLFQSWPSGLAGYREMSCICGGMLHSSLRSFTCVAQQSTFCLSLVAVLNSV
jgi:hypothetical protein